MSNHLPAHYRRAIRRAVSAWIAEASPAQLAAFELKRFGAYRHMIRSARRMAGK